MKILCISGSLRTGSFNTKLLKEAVRLFGAADAEYADIRFPLYDGDLEEAEGVPPMVQTVADKIATADAIIIASPEYNQALSGVLKNALDWISRTDGNPWQSKPVALISAAAGRAGGARANYSLRLAMAPFNTRLIQGPEVLVAGAHNEFDDAGHLTNDHYIKGLSSLMADLRSAAS